MWENMWIHRNRVDEWNNTRSKPDRCNAYERCVIKLDRHYVPGEGETHMEHTPLLAKIENVACRGKETSIRDTDRH